MYIKNSSNIAEFGNQNAQKSTKIGSKTTEKTKFVLQIHYNEPIENGGKIRKIFQNVNQSCQNFGIPYNLRQYVPNLSKITAIVLQIY